MYFIVIYANISSKTWANDHDNSEEGIMYFVWLGHLSLKMDNMGSVLKISGILEGREGKDRNHRQWELHEPKDKDLAVTGTSGM